MNEKTEKMSWKIKTIIATQAALFIMVLWVVFVDSESRCKENVQFVNAEVACEEKAAIKKTGYAKTEAELNEYIAEVKAKGEVSDIAIYFRDLESGPVFGVNELIDFAPASLLKLPMALVYLSESEENPEILTHMLSYNEKNTSSFNQNFKPKDPIKPGVSYSVEELLKRMIVGSDNNAFELLTAHIIDTKGEDFIKDTFLELGILAPKDEFDKVISVRRYASILRGIYNGSLLSIENSEKILSWLSEAEFTEGMVSTLPDGIKVAHKFGERYFPDGTKQLTDCGIVYYPKNPYLLCVMAKGKDFEGVLGAINHISGAVYKEVDSRKL